MGKYRNGTRVEECIYAIPLKNGNTRYKVDIKRGDKHLRQSRNSLEEAMKLRDKFIADNPPRYQGAKRKDEPVEYPEALRAWGYQ